MPFTSETVDHTNDASSRDNVANNRGMDNMNYNHGNSNQVQHNGKELFVGDLSYFCREQHIQQLFSSIGRVISVRIRRSDRRGHSLMHGFAKMASVEDAQRVVATFDGYMFLGRKMK